MTLPATDVRIGRVERIIEVLRVLERERKITKVRLFDLLGVTSQSSFKRVKAELARAGLPLTYSRADGHFHLPESASVARYGIDARTRAQLMQVRATLAALGGPAYDALEDVLTVLEARIALDDPDAAAVITSRHPQPRANAVFWTAIDRALTAVREHRWLSFTYASTAGGERDDRALQPYAVHTHDGRYYVWGIVEGEHVPKLFAVDRMERVTIEDDPFAPDPGLNLDDAIDGFRSIYGRCE
jgi:predicted DNA-binding transcriptional regulator YafY